MNSILHEWASENKIPKKALENLLDRFGVVFQLARNIPLDSRESALLNLVRLEESKRGTRLFRNNSGVAFDKSGRPVRFGLANESADRNRRVKSSDLIGIERGGRFVSLETKKPGWTFSGSVRELAQLNWIAFINAMGGRAKFVSSMVDYE
jgi:hypothetical protein